MRVAEDGEPVGLHFENDVQCLAEGFRRLVWQAVDQVEVDRSEAEFAHPVHRLLGHLARLDAVDSLLDFRIEILHPNRGAVEADLPQRDQVVPREPARIDLHAGFDIGRKGEMAVDDFAQPADFIRPQECGRAAAEMKLDRPCGAGFNRGAIAATSRAR